MYDLPGADTGHEWVELFNDSESIVDIGEGKTGWRFVVGEDSHILTATQGRTSLSAGVYAIIASDIQKFLEDYPEYTGILFDSSFSLSNTGETLALKDSSGTVTGTISYANTQGAAGDGNSLQKINGVWKVAEPTPGTGSTDNIVNASVVESTPSGETQTQSIPSSLKNLPIEPQIIVDAGLATRTTFTGIPIIFSAKVFNGKKEPIGYAQLVWTFGDGAHAEGSSISHSYYYPGEYTVVLDASSENLSASDRVRVIVTVPNYILKTGGDTVHSFFTIENRSSSELDLSGWYCSSGDKNFIFPKNTLIGAHKITTFASEITGLTTPLGTMALLHFPNGALAQTQNDSVFVSAPIQSETAQSHEKLNPTVVNHIPVVKENTQEASVINAIEEAVPQSIPSEKKEEGMWVWYTSIAFLGALAFLALRFVRSKSTVADEFNIVEEKDETPW